MIHAVVDAGFTCIQIRSKEAGAKELIRLCREAAEIIAAAGKADDITLVVDDRLDVVLAAREEGIKVDGIHVGQSDIPVEVCRKYLGEDSVVGLSAPSRDLINYAKTADVSGIDYFGAGPLRPSISKKDCGMDEPSISKKDCGMDEYGRIITRNYAELTELAAVSPVPVVVGGGVMASDLAELKKTGCAGFFVISAIASAPDPAAAAKELADCWDKA